MKQIVALSIAITIALIGAFSLPVLIAYKIDSSKSLWSGELTQKLELHYNEKLPVKNLALNTWTAANYLIFNEGRQGVFIGDEGWLYTKEEFDVYENMTERYRHRLKQISIVEEVLSNNGVELVFVLLPSKARIYEEHLDYYPRELDEAYRNIYSEIVKMGINAPNIAMTFEENSEEKLFLRTDTHWTPLGAKVCAKEVSEYISRDLAERVNLDQTSRYVVQQTKTQVHEGDLFNYLPLGIYQNLFGPPKEIITVHETEMLENSSNLDNALFGDLGTEIALVGSSYSANPLWSFEGYLKQALQADVINYAEEGKGPVIPMVEYLTSKDFTDNPPKLVIWEFPERYFPVEYNEVAAYFENRHSVDISQLSSF